MKKFEAWVKKNKWLSIGIGVVLIVLLYFLFFGRKSSGATARGANVEITPGNSGGGGGGSIGGAGSGDGALIDSITGQYQDIFENMKEQSAAALEAARAAADKARADSAAALEAAKAQYDAQARGFADQIAGLTNQIQAGANRSQTSAAPSIGGASYSPSSGPLTGSALEQAKQQVTSGGGFSDSVNKYISGVVQSDSYQSLQQAAQTAQSNIQARADAITSYKGNSTSTPGIPQASVAKVEVLGTKKK